MYSSSRATSTLIGSNIPAAVLAVSAVVAATQTARNEADVPKSQQQAAKDRKAFICETNQGNLPVVELGKLAQERDGQVV
jgi:hypothetical protein